MANLAKLRTKITRLERDCHAAMADADNDERLFDVASKLYAALKAIRDAKKIFAAERAGAPR
jgi:uncharacterized protein YigA (DUF484 family)